MDDGVHSQIFLRTELFLALMTFFISDVDIRRIVNLLMFLHIGNISEGFFTDLALNVGWHLSVGFSVPVHNIFERKRLLANIAHKLMICLMEKFFVSSQHSFLFVFLETNIAFKTCFLTMVLLYMEINVLSQKLQMCFCLCPK